VADKYGSTAEDGLSYTEKEYDYAREMQKPVLAFLHGNRGGIPRDKTEKDRKKRSKLEAFIEKVRRSPVSSYTSPDDLAMKVLASFVNQRDRWPAVGFVRADQVPDLKRYTEILEENARLRDELSKLRGAPLVPFEHASDIIPFSVMTGTEGNPKWLVLEMTLGDFFQTIARLILAGSGQDERLVQEFIMLLGPFSEPWRLKSSVFKEAMFGLLGKGLIDLEHRDIE
jgi:hypothetical protein